MLELPPIGVTRQHKVLLEYVAMELYQQAFATLGAAEQQAVRDDAEERYISFAFLFQSGQHHAKLKEGLKDDFTKGDNRYPKNRQQTLHLLDNHSKTAAPQTTPSEGSSFAQQSGKGRSDGGKENVNPSIRKNGRIGNAANAENRGIQLGHARTTMPMAMPKSKRAA
jgi:hypothetical protein